MKTIWTPVQLHGDIRSWPMRGTTTSAPAKKVTFGALLALAASLALLWSGKVAASAPVAQPWMVAQALPYKPPAPIAAPRPAANSDTVRDEFVDCYLTPDDPNETKGHCAKDEFVPGQKGMRNQTGSRVFLQRFHGGPRWIRGSDVETHDHNGVLDDLIVSRPAGGGTNISAPGDSLAPRPRGDQVTLRGAMAAVDALMTAELLGGREGFAPADRLGSRTRVDLRPTQFGIDRLSRDSLRLSADRRRHDQRPRFGERSGCVLALYGPGAWDSWASRRPANRVQVDTALQRWARVHHGRHVVRTLITASVR